MSAEILRRAAALMRERADCFHEGAWHITPGPAGHKEIRNEYRDDDGEWQDGFVLDIDTTSTAEHIASWHPEVALAVAKAMDDVAQAWEIADGWALDPDDDPIRFEDTVDGGWLNVARAYLGESA